MSLIKSALLLVALLHAHQSSAADTYDGDASFRAAVSPEGTLRRYFAALDQRNRDPDLDLYTPATRHMLRRWQTTETQMANLINTFRLCRAEKARIDSGRRFAVIRYPAHQRQCSPWFFESIDGAWALDLTMMQRAIRFGHNNAWRFERNADHPYDFAFVDWTFDSRGFPASEN